AASGGSDANGWLPNEFCRKPFWAPKYLLFVRMVIVWLAPASQVRLSVNSYSFCFRKLPDELLSVPATRFGPPVPPMLLTVISGENTDGCRWKSRVVYPSVNSLDSPLEPVEKSCTAALSFLSICVSRLLPR